MTLSRVEILAIGMAGLVVVQRAGSEHEHLRKKTLRMMRQGFLVKVGESDCQFVYKTNPQGYSHALHCQLVRELRKTING